MKVTIDTEILPIIEQINCYWEECENPYYDGENGESLVTIGTIVHQTFVDLKRVIVGVQEIPKNNDHVPKSITIEEYIDYLNSINIVFTEDEKGFVTPISLFPT